ncbi:Detected protein of unknown function [Hibiscus syriacus]|uniref:Uncharacterized protein n=1 Tax=Hibiscus syriacus TaxID=106335 RepID=A0A6A3CDY2_HIBSY|nr:zinc finger CCCH domain-containing protein 18-like [Hibiscus syriacus]KAE8727393.1 Detected protein of unknown function [Hibiscus syriacus]
MGCCFSSTPSPKPKHPPHQASLKRRHSPLQSPILQSHKTLSPPQEDDEEEAVIKEVLVLSETPKLPHDDQQENNTQTPPPLPPQPPKTETPVSHPIKQKQQQQEEEPEKEEETSHISQQSEIYSVSETITTTTTTATEWLNEDEATSKVNSQLKHKTTAKAIKKRPSPTNGDSTSVRARRESARGRGQGLTAARTVQRNVGSRSRSPGTGRAGAVGKSAATATEKTDNKTTSATVEGQSKREEDWKNDVSEQQGSESIENPHVSLECFIFL